LKKGDDLEGIVYIFIMVDEDFLKVVCEKAPGVLRGNSLLDCTEFFVFLLTFWLITNGNRPNVYEPLDFLAYSRQE
jgi:hypothetical protein